MTTWMLTPSLATHLKMKITFLQQQLHNSFEDEDNLSVVAIAPQSSSSLDDVDDDVIDELELDVSDNVVKEPHVSIIPMKQGFANLDEVTNCEYFDSISNQEHAKLWYSNNNKSYVVEWEMTREKNVRQSGKFPAHNALSTRALPTRQTSSFETPLDGFSYFMPDSLLVFIFEYTNKKVQNFRNRFADN